MENKFLPYKLIRYVAYPMWHGSILHSKVRKMGYQDTKHNKILSNQIQGC
jgi:hypothetical protein